MEYRVLTENKTKRSSAYDIQLECTTTKEIKAKMNELNQGGKRIIYVQYRPNVVGYSHYLWIQTKFGMPYPNLP